MITAGKEHQVELRTARLRLTSLDPDQDAEALHAAYGDPEVMRWWNFPECPDVAATRGRLRDGADAEDARLWTIREDGEAIGMAGLLGGVGVPGLTWLLRRDRWGHGYASEAAVAVVEHALGPMELPRVEAWVETTNARSLAVAHRAGLTERGVLAQRYGHRDEVHEMVVLGRTRVPEPVAVLGAEVTLPVRDVQAVSALLESALGTRTLFIAGDPPHVAGLGFGPWSAGPGLRLVATRRWFVGGVTLHLDAATEFTALHERAVVAGAVVSEPVEQPWGRREFVLSLPHGHKIVVGRPG